MDMLNSDKKTIFDLEKQKEETYKKWEATGLLDGLNKDMTIHTKKVNMATLLDGAASSMINETNVKSNKVSMAELMESEASKLLKEQNNQLDELNDYLRMLADMDKIGIRRKIVLLEGYINKIKNNIDKI
jgi:hypothetical protein